MSNRELLRSWKDPQAGAASAASPVGEPDLSGLTGAQQADTLLPWFCEKTICQGTCAMGPTVGCC